MSIYKGALITLVCLGVLACLALVLWAFFFRHASHASSQVLEPNRRLTPADMAAIESAIEFSLPAAEAVQEIALLHGKDSVLCLKVVVPNQYADDLMKSIGSRSRRTEPSRVFGPGKVVPWFSVSEGEIAAAFDEGLGTYVVFCAPESESTRIYVRVSSMSKRLSKGIYSIF